MSIITEEQRHETQNVSNDNKGTVPQDDKHQSDLNQDSSSFESLDVLQMMKSVTPLPPPPPPPVAGSVTFVLPIPVPDPGQKMKLFPWKKITSIKDNSLWSKIKNLEDPIPVDYIRLEKFFFCKENNNGRPSSAHHKQLFDQRKEMRIERFLKLFKKTPEELIEMIKMGNTDEFTYENYKELKQLLPTKEEKKRLQDISEEDMKALGKVDLFMLQLIHIPDYELWITIMKIKRELENLNHIPDNLQTLKIACEMLMTNESLHLFLRFVFHVGLYVNKGKPAGKAKGFQICSLKQLVETKSASDDTTFLEFVVNEVRGVNGTCLEFAHLFRDVLKKAERCKMQQISEEFAQLKTNIHSVIERLDSTTCSIRDQCLEFKQTAFLKIEDLQRDLDSMKAFQQEVVDFFGDDHESFSIDGLVTCCRELSEQIIILQKQITVANRSKSKQRQLVPQVRRKSDSLCQPVCVKDKRLQEILEKRRSKSESILPPSR